MKISTKRERKLRKEAHDLCNVIWGDTWSAFGNIAAQYRWLQQNSRTGHIGTLTETELEDLIKTLRRMAKKYGSQHHGSTQQEWWK